MSESPLEQINPYLNPDSFIAGYFNLWNTCEMDGKSFEENADLISVYVDENCVNRFGLKGQEGMVQIIKDRRELFPDFQTNPISTQLRKSDEQNELFVTVKFSGTFTSINLSLPQTFVDIIYNVTYKLSTEGKILGGTSTLRKSILEAISEINNLDINLLDNLTKGLF